MSGVVEADGNQAGRRTLSKETSIAFASLLGNITSLILRFVVRAPRASDLVLIAGLPLLFDLLKKLAAFEVGSDALAGISILTAAILGEYLRRIALQSAAGGMTLSMIGMLAAAAGWLAPVPGAIAQEVIDVLAVLNALRVAAPRMRLKDFGDD